MPYEGEYAQYRSIKRLVESERVTNLLGGYHIRAVGGNSHSISNILSEVRPSDWVPRIVLAVDGSHLEIPVRNGFPGAEASYVTVASVLVDLAKTRELDAHRPVDPKQLRQTEQASSIDCALPGCNVVGDGDVSANASLRRKMFEVFEDVHLFDDAESLLETYEALLAYKPETSNDQGCPYEDCQEPTRKFVRAKGRYLCPCPKRNRFYSTDALRIHEGMNTAGTNGAMFAEVMQVLERIWIVHILRVMEAKRYLGILRDTAIVLDGPLAVFGHPAWLSQAICQEIQRINNVAKPMLGGNDLLLMGVEKSGMFVQHFDSIDIDSHGLPDSYPRQTAALLDDQYIKQNIIFSDSNKPYGADTYFGRKFFYKTISGARIVATLPFLEPSHRDLHTSEPNQFPRLADAMSLLDKVVSSRYPNSITPLITAHSEAAIPLNLGKRVLEQLAKELMKEDDL